ncbi:carboxypeptidase M32 [Vulgatibacter sp.]|uniref:carboxypeptidase M32 n=1 Tax=Vulgatibacter sp. TaxID=1971226 RepID=UPI0035669041
MEQVAWDELLRRMGELRDFGGVVGLLTWDQETFMPQRSADGRAAQLAAMQALIHERVVDPRLGELLVAAAADGGLDEDRAAMVRNLGRERDRAVKVPPALVRELAQAQSRAVEAWRAARAEERFSIFQPHLERLVELRRAQADAIGHAGERYDALLEGHEPGMRVSRLEPLFAELEKALVPIVETITAAPQPARWNYASQRFPVDAQWDFTIGLLEEMGFDLTRGRQDRSTHPFTDGIHVDDVRLTTRLTEENPFQAFFSTIHEGGHGLYEQNLPRAHVRTPVGSAASMGLHESQSRLWENMIGRSLPFWRRQLPALRRLFPAQLEGVSPEAIYAAVNRVERSPIRVEADEVTYNLHILLRFQLELALLRGDLTVADLPAAWNERMRKDVGIEPKGDREGVLQDIHWAWAEFGYFPTYTLGNLYAAILHERLERDLGGVAQVIEAGRLHAVRDWLAEKVHGVGHRWDAEEIVARATGEKLSAAPFLRYLEAKYGALYGVAL